MTKKYVLKYTNHFSHPLNFLKRDSEELIITGDCKITNYDPRKENGEKKGYITINFNSEEQTINEGLGDKLSSNQSEADFSSKKFSIFSKIAQLDGDSSELSVNDIKKMDKTLIQKWGLKDLRFDYKNGVATLIWGENDILRIDFSKRKKNPLKPEIKEFTTKKQNINIDIVKDLSTVAQYTGISERYIDKILIGLEGKKKWPLCKAEYDNVPKKGFPKGFLTIGFGHTSLAGEPKVIEGMEITEKQAYQILANDIVNAKNLSINKLKNRNIDFESLPKSIQCAIIDIVFNKGPSEINKNLVANLKKGYYGAAARRTWFETPNVGLQKRNMYRFIEAIDSLDLSTKITAIKTFKKDHEVQLIKVFKKDIDAKKAWNNMCEKLNYKDGLF